MFIRNFLYVVFAYIVFCVYVCVFLFIFSQFRFFNLQNISLSHVYMYTFMAKCK